jgi:hypothetical protein
LTSILPIAVEDGSRIEPDSIPFLRQAVDQRLAGDRRGGRILAGVADAAAVVERAVEGVGRRHRNAVGLGGLDDIVVRADLRRGQDEAVERRVLDDLVQDLDLARRVVGRRLGAEQEDLGADQVGGDGGADIDRIEEAVAGGMRDDGEGQLAVGRMEVLRLRTLHRGLFEGIAADRLGNRAGLRQGARGAERYRRGKRRERKYISHFHPPSFEAAAPRTRSASRVFPLS